MHQSYGGIGWGRGDRAFTAKAHHALERLRCLSVCLSVCVLRGFTSLFCQSVKLVEYVVSPLQDDVCCLSMMHPSITSITSTIPLFYPPSSPRHPLPFQSNALRLPISTRRSHCSCMVKVTCISIQARPRIHGYSGYRLACRRP